jgi:DNA-binding MarR family transcriptional regulator
MILRSYHAPAARQGTVVPLIFLLTIVVITTIVGGVTGRLQKEIKQTRPFASVEEEALLGLLRTADGLARRGAEVLKPSGLSITQYNVLRILRGAGEAGLACGEIGERMITRDPDITRLLDRMEARGLLVRARSTSDRRVVTTRITPAGLALLKKLDGVMAEETRRLMQSLGATRLRTLVRMLDALREGFHE